MHCVCMTVTTDEITFQAYRTLDGSVRHTTRIRRNGYWTLQFDPEPASDASADPDHPVFADVPTENLVRNLTATQRRTWLRILAGRSISDIAEEENRSREAIYERIRGKNGDGGMAARNSWVCLWWAYRIHFQHELY